MALVAGVEEGAALPRLGLVRALPRPPRQRQGVELVLNKYLRSVDNQRYINLRVRRPRLGVGRVAA